MSDTGRRYSVRDVAASLGCHKTAIIKKIAAGRVPDVIREGRTYTLGAEAVAWLRAHVHLQHTPIGLRKAGVDYSGKLSPSNDFPGEPGAAQSMAGGAKEEFTLEEGRDAQTITSRSTRIATLEDALAHAQVDLAVWAVDRYVVNRWEMGYKDAANQPGTQALYQVKVWLTRRVAQPYVDACDGLMQRMAAHAPAYAPTTLPRTEDPHLLVMSLHDQHYAKLAYRREVGDDYDVLISDGLFRDAVADIIGKARGFAIDKVLFPVGSDFVHIDSVQNTTAHGTPQDTDGRLSRAVEIASMAVVHAIDTLLQVAPVDIEFVPGNHDQTTSWHIARFLMAWYRQCDAVSVNCEPIARKYVQYGQTLIGLTHGNSVKLDKLPVIMATEVPHLWAATAWREWHTGHLHSKREMQFNAVNNHDGVVVRVLPSLCQRDMYHYEHGYIGNRQAEGYLYSHERGPSAYVISVARGNAIVGARG
jgi:hypothetical protein